MQPLIFYLHNLVSAEEIGCSMANYVTTDGNWNWFRIASCSPLGVQLRIAAIKMPRMEEGEDQIYWAHLKHGNFTIGSSYNVLNQNDWKTVHLRWRLAWKWKGPQRIRVFIWLLLNGRLNTKEELHRRCSMNDPICDICSSKHEFLIHVLRDYIFARQVWTGLLSLSLHQDFFNSDFKTWLCKNMMKEMGNQRYSN